MKFEEAYCTREHRMMTISETKEIYNKNPQIFASRYKSTLVCPECRKAQLTFTNASSPYFRAFPEAAHIYSCSLQQDEMSNKEAKSFLMDSCNKTKVIRQIQSLMHMLLSEEEKGVPRSCLKGTAEEPSSSTSSSFCNNEKRIPRKRIDIPFREEDFNCYKLFYGDVNLSWEKEEKNSSYRILLRSTGSKKNLCRIKITENVYIHISNKSKEPSTFDCKIVFLGCIQKTDKGYPVTTLIHSDYLCLLHL